MTTSVLSIAGSDPSGGAGVQADLKVFSRIGVHGLSVITSITSQNTRGVLDVFRVPLEVIENQLAAVFDDFRVAAVKTGALIDEEVVRAVATRLDNVRFLVVDPVIHSSSGAELLSSSGVSKLMEDLIPLASLVTPNIREAEVLSGCRVETSADIEEACRVIAEQGAGAVLVKGGHLEGAAVDYLLDADGTFRSYSHDRVGGGDYHGTGCNLSSAVTALLAKGVPLSEAVGQAKEIVRDAIIHAISPGKGMALLDPLAMRLRSAELMDVVSNCSSALKEIKKGVCPELIPEIQSNLAMAPGFAEREADVVGLKGRIIRSGDEIVTVSCPEPGGSRHVARIVLTVMDSDPTIRSCMNLRYTPEALEVCKELGLSISSFDREQEPDEEREVEGRSLIWGIKAAIEAAGCEVPDAIYDTGGWGKEACIRILGRDAMEVASKVLSISEIYKKRYLL